MNVVLIRRGHSCRPTMPHSGSYPLETTRVATLLRDEGLHVLFADEEPDREYLASEPDEHWLPILDFGETKLADIGEVIVKLIRSYLPPAGTSATPSGNPKLHLEIFYDNGRTVLEGDSLTVFAIARHLGDSPEPPT